MIWSLSVRSSSKAGGLSYVSISFRGYPTKVKTSSALGYSSYIGGVSYDFFSPTGFSRISKTSWFPDRRRSPECQKSPYYTGFGDWEDPGNRTNYRVMSVASALKAPHIVWAWIKVTFFGSTEIDGLFLVSVMEALMISVLLSLLTRLSGHFFRERGPSLLPGLRSYDCLSILELGSNK